MTLSTEEFRRRDYRTKCRKCKRWMRKEPTEATPAKRREIPVASTCTDCPLDGTDLRRIALHKKK